LLDSADAAFWAIVVAAVGTCLTYVMNERSKRAERRATATAEARIRSYADMQKQFRDWILMLRAYRMIRGAEPERGLAFGRRFGDLSIVATYCFHDLKLDEELFKAADAKDEKRLDGLRRSMFIRCEFDLKGARDAFQEAYWMARLVALDGMLRGRLDAFWEAASACNQAMYAKDDKEFEAARDATEAMQKDLVDQLAISYARDLGRS